MIKFILFLLFGMGVFALSFIGNKKYQNTTLYALAIGGVVNANYFQATDYPIVCFNLPFGIDSLIYTLFAFCVMVMLMSDSKKSAYLLALSSIIAIVFSAFMEIIAELLVNGSTAVAWSTFASFMISALASVVAVIVAVECVDRLKSKYSSYLCMALGVAIISFVNGTIYYVTMALIFSASGDKWPYMVAAFLGKGIALLYSLIALKVLNILKKKS